MLQPIECPACWGAGRVCAACGETTGCDCGPGTGAYPVTCGDCGGAGELLEDVDMVDLELDAGDERADGARDAGEA